MGKSAGRKTENTFRFQTFSERIADINIDVIHQIRHHDDAPEETNTYFGAALAKQAELNCTDHFTAFRKEISEQVQTFAQLVHHESKIVTSLKEHLLVPNSMALPALLDLVVQLARDLQMDFYPYFPDFFTIVVRLLNTYTQDSEVLEKCFTCLSYVFKFLWRYLVNDIQIVYGYFSSLLSQQCKAYVRNFAAESFAFLMRKVKDPDELFTFLFASLKDSPDKCEGVGRLLFEMLKGVKGQFHSCSAKMFPMLLSKLGPRDKQSQDALPWHCVETALETTLTSMACHSNKEHTRDLWAIFLTTVADMHRRWSTAKKMKVKATRAAVLERLLRLLTVWIQYRHGALIAEPDTVCKVLLDCLKGASLPDGTGAVLLDVTSALLVTSHATLSVENSRRLIPAVYRTDYPVAAIFTFTRALFDLPLFEKDVLPVLLPYIQSTVAMETSRDQALLLVSQLILHKSSTFTDGSGLEDMETYMLDFGSSCSTESCSFPAYIVSLLGADTTQSLSVLWATLTCLPHVRPIANEADVNRQLANIISRLGQMETGDAATTDSRLFVLGQALVAMVMMQQGGDLPQLVSLDLVTTLLQRHSTNLHALRFGDIYFTTMANECVDDMLTTKIFMDIFPSLQQNISSPFHQVRLLTLRILASFNLPLPDTGLEAEVEDVFTICLCAERTATTVHTYREKQLHLQKLDYSAVQQSIPAGPLHQVPLRFLIGCLFLNFKFLWQPITRLIESHAHGMDQTEFWDVYCQHLMIASEKSEEELHQAPTSDHHEVSPAETASLVDSMFNDRVQQMGTDTSRPDYTNFRYHIWKSMQEFTDKCETKSKQFVPLFFRFLKNEYYLSDLSVAPTQNLLKSSREHIPLEEELEMCDIVNPETDTSDPVIRDMARRPRTRSVSTAEEETMDQDDGDHSPTRTTWSSKKRSISECSQDSNVSNKSDTVEKKKRTKSSDISSDKSAASDSSPQLTGSVKTVKRLLPVSSSVSSDSIVELPEYESPVKHKTKPSTHVSDTMGTDTAVSGPAKSAKKSLVKSSTTGKGKRRKAAASSLVVQLQLFAKFKSPRSMFMEPQLRELYFDLLVHRNAEVQKVAYDCIMTYKFKYLTPYRENFERLLDDESFKNELVLFSIDDENSVISPDHRVDLLPVLMRILYGKMHSKTGKGTSGKQYSGVRQAIVFRFLNGCRMDELGIFIDLLFAPFQQFVTDNPLKMSRDTILDTDFTAVLPIKKLHGALNSIDVIFKKLGHLLDSFLPTVLQIMVGMASLCCACLDRRDQLLPYVINPLKVIRQMAAYRLIQVFEDYEQYRWRAVEIDAVFEAVVWPQLDKLPHEGLYHPTPLLKFLQCCSKHHRYYMLLAKHRESDKSLTPLTYVFQLLLSKDVSTKVANFILQMVYNLLQSADTEDTAEAWPIDVCHVIKLQSAESIDDSAVGVQLLLPHIPSILTYIERTMTGLHTQLNRSQGSCRELSILSRISRFVQDEGQCGQLVDLLLPFLAKKVSRSLKTEADILSSVLNLVKLVGDQRRLLPAVSKLFSTLRPRTSRTLLCDVFHVICKDDDQLGSLPGIVTQLNAWDKRRMDEPDYMLRLGGFQMANRIIKEMVTMETDVCLALIHNCAFFISTVDDMSLRDSATHCMVTLVSQFGTVEFDQVSYQRVILGGLLPEVKVGLRSKSETVRHEFVTILISLVDTFGDQPNFTELKALQDADIEADFYENIKHIQHQKRSRGLRRLIKFLGSTKVRCDVMLTYFLPIVSSFLTDETYKKYTALQDAAVDAIGEMCRTLPWKHYLHQLKYYLQQLPKRVETQKLYIRIVVSVLDAFHFDLTNSQLNVQAGPAATTEVIEEAPTDKDPDGEDAGDKGEETLDEIPPVPEINDAADDTDKMSIQGKQLCSESLATKIHSVILKSIVAQLHKILVEKIRSEEEHKLARSNFAEDNEILRVPIALAMVKLLQTLPRKALERHLPGILLKVCNFLKSRSTDIRNTARDTLVKILTCLGPRFFPFVLSELRGTLLRGYQRHVLCFTVHLLLKKMGDSIRPGDIDICLKMLQEVLNEEIFGEVAEEKEVEGILSKVFEARSSKSYESYELIARYIGRGSLLAIVEPLKQILETTHSHRSARKVQDILKKIVIGLMENSDVSVDVLLVFIHTLTTQTLPQLADTSEAKIADVEEHPGRKPQSCLLLPPAPPRGGSKPKAVKKTNVHVLIEFGLQILNMCSKRQKILSSNTTHLEMLDPLVPMMADCLSSKYIRVNAQCLRSLSWLLKFPLPALQTNITRLANGMFILLRNYASAGAAKGDNLELVTMLFKAVTVLVRDVKFYKLDGSQLQVLLTFCDEDLHDYHRQGTAFSLLKAILSRKLNVPDVHELVKEVQQMSITADSAYVRRECRQVTQQYLLDYSLGKKLQGHLEFYVSQLSYTMETGRESALEMMATFFSTFPQDLLSQYAGFFFIPMSASLVNDDSAKCRKLTSLAIKSLLGKLDNNNRTSLFSIAIKWFMDTKLRHKTLASQLCGLFVEVEGPKFEQRLPDILPVIEQQLEPGKYEKVEEQALEHDYDHMLYNTLNTLLKILRECSHTIQDARWIPNMDVIWEHTQGYLTYPHIWVQLAASQLFGLLFAAWQPEQLISVDANTEKQFITREPRQKLKELAGDFVTQLQSELLNDDLASQVVKNMIFIAKVAKHCDLAMKDTVADMKAFSVAWLIRKMTREAHHEAIHNTRVYIKRSNVFKWMAGVSLDLGADRLPPVLKIMVPPLQREITDSTTTQDPAVKSLAQEVLDLLKKTAGLERFTDVYTTTQKVRADRKDERKRVRAYQAVAMPEVAAKRKLRKNLAKKESKKRRVGEMRPSKKAKKRKYQEFNVAD